MKKIFNLFSPGDKDATALSVPDEKILYGVRIRKLPVGQYLKALSTIKNLPEMIMKECFPGEDPVEIMGKFKTINEDTLVSLAGDLLRVVPEKALQIIATLIDCPYEKIRDELTPKELFEILREFWRINDMSNFWKDVKETVMSNPAIRSLKSN